MVVTTIRGKLEEVEHLGSSFKLHCATLLPQCQGCNPDGNQAILAKRQSVPRMADDLEKEFSAMPTGFSDFTNKLKQNTGLLSLTKQSGYDMLKA